MEISKNRKVTSTLFKKLKKAGKKPRTIKRRVKILAGNAEIWSIIDEVLRPLPMSNYLEINFPAFDFLSKFYKHTEIDSNLTKLRALKNQLNKDQAIKDKKEKRKKK